MIAITVTNLISRFMIIFAVGATLGWVLEFIYRNTTIKSEDVINPGFLGGPYLPIYGFGLVLVHLFASLDITFAPAVLLFTLCATLLELLTGVFFYKFFHLRLWDYTKEPFNLGGHICLRFSFYWLLIGAVSLRFLYSLTESAILWMHSHAHFSFYLGVFYGVVLSDIVNSFNIASTLSKKLRDLKQNGLPHILDYGNFGLHLRRAQKLLRERNVLSRFLLPFGSFSRKQMEVHLDSFFEKLNFFKLGK